MKSNEYQKFCRRTAKKFNSRNKEIFTWGLGIAGEAGDVAGCIKKTFSHGDDQRAGLKENLGDTMWYIAVICDFFGWKLEDVMRENVEKLKKRHPKGFLVKSAKKSKRRDWNE